MYNLFSCEGFGRELMGGCSIAWMGIGLLIFVVLITRKQSENFGIDFNLLGGIVGAFIPYLIIVSITGSTKWSLLAGLLGTVIGGFLGGTILGGSEGGDFG